MPLAGGEHDHRGPADEPASLGALALPPVPVVDPDDGNEDDRLDDGAPTQGAGRAPRGRRVRGLSLTFGARGPARYASGPPALTPVAISTTWPSGSCR